MSLEFKDIECLKAARDAMGGWRPWSGVYGRAQHLAAMGYLQKAGTTAMPPHVCYVISDYGTQAIEIYEALRGMPRP